MDKDYAIKKLKDEKETLEKHCDIAFEQIRMALPETVQFGKDTKLSFWMAILQKNTILFRMIFVSPVLLVRTETPLVGRDGFEPSYSNENRFTVCRL